MAHAQSARRNIPKAQGVVAPLKVRRRLAAIIKADGEAAAIKRLNLARQTLARVVSGLPVRVATLAFVRAQLGGA